MKKQLSLVALAYTLLCPIARCGSILVMDPVTHRPTIIDDSSLTQKNVPFLTEQPPQPTQLTQSSTATTPPPPPPELEQMPQLSFSQATKTPCPQTTQSSLRPAGPEIRGCLRIDDYDGKIPEFRICFNGKETTSNREGFYSIPLDNEELTTFSLVLCRNFKQQFDTTNTIKNVSLIPEKDYKCSTFKKRNGYPNSWIEQETRIDDKHFVMPSNSVIVLIPPKYIDRLEPWEAKVAPSSIKLPAIVLKKEFLGKPLERTAAKSLLYSLDKTVFHEPIKETKKVDQNNPKVCLSLAQ